MRAFIWIANIFILCIGFPIYAPVHPLPSESSSWLTPPLCRPLLQMTMTTTFSRKFAILPSTTFMSSSSSSSIEAIRLRLEIPIFGLVIGFYFIGDLLISKFSYMKLYSIILDLTPKLFEVSIFLRMRCLQMFKEWEISNFKQISNIWKVWSLKFEFCEFCTNSFAKVFLR